MGGLGGGVKAWLCKVLVKLDVHSSSRLFVVVVFTQAGRFASYQQQSVL